ncbi:Hypothetical predicted protein [Cloeon dipterum]|nr:Hypothetical predicted protein [Cloeon dipterum]
MRVTSEAPIRRKSNVTVRVTTDAPDCPFRDGGVRYKRHNINHCFAECLGLFKDTANEDSCKFNPETWNAADQYCSNKFKPNQRSNKKVFCNFDTVSLDGARVAGIKGSASKWIVDSNFCTHILLYPLVKYDEARKKAVFMDEFFNTLRTHIKTFQSARLKVLLTIGNFWDSAKDMPLTISPRLFSAIARSDDQRNSFVVDVVSIVKNYNLDGVNIRWIFPGSPFAVSEGFLADKSNYVTLMSNFTSLLKPGGLLLTTECSGNKAIISRGLDIPKVAEAVDYLFVYATDYGGTRFSFTSLSTPNKEVRQSLEVFKNQINDNNQIILSIKPDVEVFDLLKSNKLAKIGVPTVTDKREQIAWNKFLYRVLVTEKGKWEITKSNNEALQSFACDGTKWASYDDMFSIQQRMEIVRSFGLGGVHVVAVFNDDISNDIGCGPTPVLRSINEIVRGFNECVLPSCP